MTKKNISVKLDIPEKVKVEMSGDNVTVTGPKGSLTKAFANPSVSVKVADGVEISAEETTKKEKAVVNTYVVLLRNMMTGVTEGYTYKLKVCSGHFPMNVTFANGVVSVKNLLGEKVPRTVKVDPKVKVQIEGAEIVVSGNDKELVGQTAANLEKSTQRQNFDRRIFQDGIFLTSKGR